MASFQLRGKNGPPKANKLTPEGRSGHLLLHNAADDKLVLIGGHNESGPLSDVWTYNVEDNEWFVIEQNSGNTPLPRIDMDGCILNGKVYVLGGMQNDGDQVLIYNDLWCFDLEENVWTMIWEECPVSERMGHICIGLTNSEGEGDHMIVHGGECMGNVFNDTWLYTVSDNSWTVLDDGTRESQSPCPRFSHVAAYLPSHGKIVLFGGSTIEEGQPVHLNDLWQFGVGEILGEEELGEEERQCPSGWSQIMCPDDAMFPSPRDMPAMLPLVNEDGTAAKILVMGGFGLQEIAVEKDKDVGAVDELSMAIAEKMEIEIEISAGDQDEDKGDGEGVELRYLSDAWTIDLESGSGEELDLQSSASADGALSAPAFDINTKTNTNTGACRGCRIVQCDGLGYSFGGFDGETFKGSLDIISLEQFN